MLAPLDDDALMRRVLPAVLVAARCLRSATTSASSTPARTPGEGPRDRRERAAQGPGSQHGARGGHRRLARRRQAGGCLRAQEGAHRRRRAARRRIVPLFVRAQRRDHARRPVTVRPRNRRVLQPRPDVHRGGVSGKSSRRPRVAEPARDLPRYPRRRHRGLTARRRPDALARHVSLRGGARRRAVLLHVRRAGEPGVAAPPGQGRQGGEPRRRRCGARQTPPRRPPPGTTRARRTRPSPSCSRPRTGNKSPSARCSSSCSR